MSITSDILRGLDRSPIKIQDAVRMLIMSEERLVLDKKHSIYFKHYFHYNQYQDFLPAILLERTITLKRFNNALAAWQKSEGLV